MEQVAVPKPGQASEDQWVALPGGELEGRRPSVLCGPCRMRRAIGAERKAVCFECYKADARRQRAFEAAASVDTGSAERFQFGLPFEPVDRSRLDRLKAERAASRQQLRIGVGRFVDKRRRAQISARHALNQLGAGLRAHGVYAAELQLPESWLPFVVSR
jgi:hypothetical protein